MEKWLNRNDQRDAAVREAAGRGGHAGAQQRRRLLGVMMGVVGAMLPPRAATAQVGTVARGDLLGLLRPVGAHVLNGVGLTPAMGYNTWCGRSGRYCVRVCWHRYDFVWRACAVSERVAGQV